MVRVEKWKWPRRIEPPGRPVVSWDARELGQDHFGTWLFCPRGAQHVRDDEQVTVLPCDAVQLLPVAGWWAAWWWADEHRVSVDICTPPRLHGSSWRYVDLELDLALLADGTVEVVDEDEFDAAVRKGTIPEDVAVEALESLAWVRRAMTGGQEPFQQTGWRWLTVARRAFAGDGSRSD